MRKSTLILLFITLFSSCTQAPKEKKQATLQERILAETNADFIKYNTKNKTLVVFVEYDSIPIDYPLRFFIGSKLSLIIKELENSYIDSIRLNLIDNKLADTVKLEYSIKNLNELKLYNQKISHIINLIDNERFSQLYRCFDSSVDKTYIKTNIIRFLQKIKKEYGDIINEDIAGFYFFYKEKPLCSIFIRCFNSENEYFYLEIIFDDRNKKIIDITINVLTGLR